MYNVYVSIFNRKYILYLKPPVYTIAKGQRSNQSR